jgi:hypothetical protein
VPTGKYLAVLGSVRPGWSKLRLVSQEEKLFFDLIKQPVCHTGIVRRDTARYQSSLLRGMTMIGTKSCAKYM